MKSLRVVLGVLAFMCAGFGAAASEWEDLDALEVRIREFAGADGGEAVVRPVDRRLRLAACQNSVAVDWLDARRRAVVARCDAPVWRVHVGVVGANRAVSARTAVEDRRALVLVRAVPRGAVISAEDIEEAVPGAWFSDVVTQTEDAIGRVARRALPAGSALRSSALARPTLVERGDPVTVRYAAGAFAVAVDGVAEEDGTEGEGIRVRNAATGKMMQARVIGAGEVAVASLNFLSDGRSP